VVAPNWPFRDAPVAAQKDDATNKEYLAKLRKGTKNRVFVLFMFFFFFFIKAWPVGIARRGGSFRERGEGAAGKSCVGGTFDGCEIRF
jgi:hypothetical protein